MKQKIKQPNPIIIAGTYHCPWHITTKEAKKIQEWLARVITWQEQK